MYFHCLGHFFGVSTKNKFVLHLSKALAIIGFVPLLPLLHHQGIYCDQKDEAAIGQEVDAPQAYDVIDYQRNPQQQP